MDGAVSEIAVEGGAVVEGLENVLSRGLRGIELGRTLAAEES